jgi:dTDP-4-amino-4,6-dideoxygalactose transaminase
MNREAGEREHGPDDTTEVLSLPSDADASGRTFGRQELELLTQVVESGTLNCTKGTVVDAFERAFAELYGVPFACTTTSGTAAIHAAVAAVDPNPGDEIVTTPITDMGGIAPIVYQGAIPVFADVDARTYNVTAETIARKISRRTRAIVVTHLFGNPCDMDPIMALARAHGLPVIEDCAQAYLATYEGRLVGTIGDIGCFSLQQGKHITSGEGGIVITRDPATARRIRLFHDKAWGYGDERPDHYFLAPNYRMTELQGAVALGQLGKLRDVVASRRSTAELFTSLIQGIPGVEPPAVTAGGEHVYWKYCLDIDERVAGAGVGEFAERLRRHGVFSAPRYIQKPAFACQVLRDRVTFGSSHWPWDDPSRADEPEIEYRPEEYPGTYEALARILVLPWNERYTERHVRDLARVVRGVAESLSPAPAPAMAGGPR